MPEQTHEQIMEVFGKMLESLAFMFTDAVEKDDVPTDLKGCMEASISYDGPNKGTLTLLAPREVAGELAANLLGFEPEGDEADEMAIDALGELMNVTLGHILSEMEGDKPVYDLSPPDVHEAPPERWGQVVESPLSVAYLVEDSPVLLQFSPAA